MKLLTEKKGIFIAVGIALALVLMIVISFASTGNRAIGMEEQINEATASIKVQEKRRVDLVYNLVDTVESYAEHEKGLFTELSRARSEASSGNVEQASMAIKAVAEAYPEIKADQAYMQLMTELTVTENMIAQYRENFNYQVKAYNKFVRKFPNTMILGVVGYEVLSFEYTDYQAPQDAPQNLFDK